LGYLRDKRGFGIEVDPLLCGVDSPAQARGRAAQGLLEYFEAAGLLKKNAETQVNKAPQIPENILFAAEQLVQVCRDRPVCRAAPQNRRLR
jgi:hypothetical protein